MAAAARQRRTPLAVVIAGGGTGGHVFPGLAVAREILRRAPDARVTFAGTAHGLEARIVPREGFELDVIQSAGLKGKSIASWLRGLLLVPLGLAGAWRLLSRRRPAVVIGVGGYSSGPVVLAAAMRGLPTMVLEQNAVPGLTNRWLARWVRAAAVAYEETLSYFHGKGIVTGNPVRAEFFADTEVGPTTSRDDAGAPGRSRLLILGGSQGAHAVNLAMAAAAPELGRLRPGLEVVHQTGARDLALARESYRRAGMTARVEPFLDAVAREMRAADLVVCRAGATTLAELAASGRPALLVPFGAAADDHQRRNAQVLAAAGAAVVVDEREVTGGRLAADIGRLLADRAALEAMGRAMRRLGRPDAATRIVDRVFELAGER
jgi:UDP-N-acetylglucosamine--N-acetylmuramyl-(pentapeptide) pyrophosphoryl-undecaprenol N-acetylglucosamine transferase